MLIDVDISRDGNVIKKEAEKVLKYEDLTKEIQRMMNVKNKNDTSNSRSGWNHLKIIQKITEQHNRKAQNKKNKKKLPTKATLGKFYIQRTVHRGVFL